jgi:glycosyltransferase involved in cell wall biosynthesis
VAYVSLYEGFGLPVLEAMACGAPVVAARAGALEEVSGDAAVLVDPLDAEAIAAGLTEAIDRREELRARGLQRARAFDWRAVARETVAVYREAAA